MKLFGIDEAGKGPIIGPLVMSCVVVEDLSDLEQMNIKDSKKLSPQQRDDLYEELKDLVTHETILLDVDEIDTSVAKNELNLLEARTTVKLINKHWPERAYVDCPSTNPRAYKSFLFERLDNKKTTLICEHKADEKYIVCAAASIIAKVTRDRVIEKMKAEIGIDFGSGYLGDPKTQKFLEQHWKTYAQYFRKSWAPYKRLVRNLGQKKLDAFFG